MASCPPPPSFGTTGKACPTRRAAFSLVEILIVTTLLALIVLALMDVFSSTQRAFRASVTQVDVLEGSRAAMELITDDLRKLTASNGDTNYLTRDVSFFAIANGDGYYSYGSPAYTPLLQSLPGSTSDRVNVLQYFFILGRENTKWTGTGYVVNSASASPLYPLYRYYSETNITAPAAPHALFTNFLAQINSGKWTNMSHLVDGVVHLVVRPYDLNGVRLTNGYTSFMVVPPGVFTYGSPQGEGEIDFSGAVVPASVEIQMGVVEDRILARAESLPNNLPSAPPNDRRSLYLLNQSGAVHLFRQTVNVQNVDRSVYQ